MLAFRAARQGLASLKPRSLAEAAACPVSEFQRGSGLLALAARTSAIDRERYDAALDSGELADAHSLRAAIHVLAPGDVGVFGCALISDEPDELLEQLGEQVKALLREHALDPREALEEVAEATAAALEERGRLDKNELHEELRGRVRTDLLPWCEGCGSHHVAPMLWRFALVRVGARRDSRHRYVRGEPGEAISGAEAARRLLRFYGPATAAELEGWAGLAGRHARRLWQEIEGDVTQVDGAAVLAEDVTELESPPLVEGLRLLPPGDPFLQRPNRATLVPDAALRKRVFRPVASPGVVLQDGEVGGLWRARGRGARLELEVEPLGRIDREALAAEAERVAELRGAREVRLLV